MSTHQAERQAASFIAWKNRRSRQFISDLPVWMPGVAVMAGDLYQEDGAAWMAGANGTTGDTPPQIAHDDVSFDGRIYWFRQWRLLTGGNNG